LPLAFAIAQLFGQPIEAIFEPGDDKSAGLPPRQPVPGGDQNIHNKPK
jgi:hypothetical protein